MITTPSAIIENSVASGNPTARTVTAEGSGEGGAGGCAGGCAVCFWGSVASAKIAGKRASKSEEAALEGGGAGAGGWLDDDCAAPKSPVTRLSSNRGFIASAILYFVRLT
jgi:hypothetical protein